MRLLDHSWLNGTRVMASLRAVQECKCLIVDLQQAMLYDKSTHSKSYNQNGVELTIPVPTVMSKEPKYQLKSQKELEGQTLNSKAIKSIQQLGIPQEISDRTYVAVDNPTRPILHCAFWNYDCKYPKYGNRWKLSVHSMEYMLTSDKPSIYVALKNRLKVGMQFGCGM